MLPVIGETRPWADPAVVAIGRLEMRPPSVSFERLTHARRGDRSASPWFLSLSGRWRFRLFDHPDHVPERAITESTGGPGWTRVAVPGNWTLQDAHDQTGVADLPQYTNVRMPFAGPPPALPERNPTGIYRRTFRVPSSWSGRQIVVRIGGAESVHVVYVNGTFVGYGTDARLDSEYDITDAARPGVNEIAVVVLRWSAQSYVEDQDQWWMAGLHREVVVEARAPTHLTSLECDTGFRPAGAAGRDGTTVGVGELTVRAAVGGREPPGVGWRVRTWVETLAAERLVDPESTVVPHRFDVPYLFEGHVATSTFEVPGVHPWSAEAPTRYRVIAELLDPHGAIVEVQRMLVGFRSVTVQGGQLEVNGRPVWVFGVNRHDHHPTRGKAVTIDDLRDDLLAMRRHNITWVRTAHYPNDARLLDLCDELGMYVVDEADIESHAYNTSLGNDPRYLATWMERGTRMVARDRNHPSVVMWSLGNESGYGPHHDALAAAVRRRDPSRPLHYEGAVFHAGWMDGGRNVTDVVCPMYPPIDAVAEYGEQHRERDDARPLVLCEYSHAMGNSNGSLADYWDAMAAAPGLQGGFIWEWKDHGLTATLPNGRRGFAYGGQFGEAVHDGNFVADGLMSADLRPHPAMQEVAWVYRPVTVERSGRERLRVTNRRSFTGLDDLEARWELMVAGQSVAEGLLAVPSVEPLGSVVLPLPRGVPDGPDVQLTIRWRQRDDTPWAPAGHLVAWDQIELRSPAPSRPPRAGVAAADDPDAEVPTMAELVAPIELCLFRAPTDNDGFKLMAEPSRRLALGGQALWHWLDAGLDRRPADELVTHRHLVEVLTDGSQLHQHEVVVPDELDDLPRIGVRFELRPGFDRVRWFGRGPLENYPDRNRGALVGVWESGVDELPYLVPQEFGLRTDCRWFEFVRSATGASIRLDVVAPAVMHVSATRCSVEDLHAAAHATDLRPRRTLVVHADVAHRGVGTASCGPDVLERYRIRPGRYRFAYRLALHTP